MTAQTLAPPPVHSRAIRVRGCVQGVGFRPFVWQVATRLGLCGHVANDGDGVTILASGNADALDALVTALRDEAPPLARVQDITVANSDAAAEQTGFAIAPSVPGSARTGIAPDAATCPACLAEVRDPAERRHGYALTNCTHCGPRLTLEGEGAGTGDPIASAATMLRAGRILAIKGLGGYHLACLATNDAAVAELRRRKVRDAKPFAVMMPSLAHAERYCLIDDQARSLLESPAAPIVLVAMRAGDGLPASLAPGLDRLGIMLPYTPLHHLLMDAIGQPLVMTSGNRSNEPQVTDDDEARDRLADLVDGWLLHDRRILNRLDDSVIAPASGGPIVLRRARGMAPSPIDLHADLACDTPVLAMGGDLKSTFCLLRGREAIVSQHFGDLADAAALDDYRTMIDLYRGLYDFAPGLIVVDAHADYLSARFGRALGDELGVPVVAVAHHHAHMASCLAENGFGTSPCALGLICDGLGMGEDGTLWGAEVLGGNLAHATRTGALPAVPLPGGNAAMKQPWRNLVAHLDAACGDEWPIRLSALSAHLPPPVSIATIRQAMARKVNCPPCSSAGRLFDAVAAALGVHPLDIGYEGQAAMALEALARPYAGQASAYPLALRQSGDEVHRIDLRPFWEALASDVAAGTPTGAIAARFHASFVNAMLMLAEAAGPPLGTPVALSGGVMQNSIVRDGLARALEERGLIPVVQRQLPAGDGGLSLGQAAIAAARINEGTIQC